MAWFYLPILAYLIGQVIFLMEVMSDHPGWRLVPCAILALAWPYLTVRRYIPFLRA